MATGALLDVGRNVTALQLSEETRTLLEPLLLLGENLVDLLALPAIVPPPFLSGHFVLSRSGNGQ